MGARKMILRSLSLLICLVATSAHANLITDSHDIVLLGPNSSSVDYTYFGVSTAGNFDLSATNTGGSLDTFIRLFLDDGGLDAGDQIAFDDDGGIGLNSLISSLFLPVGNYILAMGDFFLEVEAAVSGVNIDDSSPEFGTADIAISSEQGVAFLRSPAPVPVPATLWLFGLGLALIGWRRLD
ncbi:DVUA0089 family protein [Parahaliea mediterranea]|uniref:PEP-CTERM sorting domain-containing protein n=1 Tax=Parahaliea mediterranea TaxID=651086 RepID=A0A939DIA8_9GAMM|nr:DVUA0089 family protein [Parahaliea mediterranea]MBN7798624.1 PEP-CTERM sorting domain-containing protein [Parahaliea mediterranea]